MSKRKGAINTTEKGKEGKKNLPRKKPYIFLNGRDSTKFSLELYGDNAEYCRKMGKKLGFTSGPVAHYINYLIDKDSGYLQFGASEKVVYADEIKDEQKS